MIKSCFQDAFGMFGRYSKAVKNLLIFLLFSSAAAVIS
jgi:hypothetical protein